MKAFTPFRPRKFSHSGPPSRSATIFEGKEWAAKSLSFFAIKSVLGQEPEHHPTDVFVEVAVKVEGDPKDALAPIFVRAVEPQPAGHFAGSAIVDPLVVGSSLLKVTTDLTRCQRISYEGFGDIDEE